MKHLFLSIVLFILVSTALAQNWEVLGSTQVTTNEVDQFDMAVFDDTLVYVAFADLKANRRAQTKQYTNGSWSSLGPASGFSGSTSDLFDLQVQPDGSPILAFRDYNFKFGTRVLRYDMQNTSRGWQGYGAQNNGLSNDYTKDIKLALNPSGIPYVGLNNRQFNSNFEIYGFDSATTPYQLWTNSSPGGQSLGLYDMAFSPSGELYIVYQDPDLDTNTNLNLNDRITVKKRVNDSWVLVGEPGISRGKTTEISIEFDSKGTPYIAFVHSFVEDRVFGRGAAVRKFDGEKWVPVGPENITTFYTTYLDFKISPNDTPVISYHPENKLEAFAFNGVEWQKVGLNSASEGLALWSKIEFGERGTLYAVYKDRANGDKVTVTRYRGPLTSAPKVNSTKEAISNTPKLLMYPNPATRNFTLSLLPSGPKQIEVIDMNGRKIYEENTSENTTQIRTIDWPAGVYTVVVKARNSKTRVKMLVNPN